MPTQRAVAQDVMSELSAIAALFRGLWICRMQTLTTSKLSHLKRPEQIEAAFTSCYFRTNERKKALPGAQGTELT